MKKKNTLRRPQIKWNSGGSIKLFVTFKFIEQKRFPGTPSRVQSDSDWYRQTRFRQHIGQRCTIQLISQHVLVIFIRVQLPSAEDLT